MPRPEAVVALKLNAAILELRSYESPYTLIDSPLALRFFTEIGTLGDAAVLD